MSANESLSKKQKESDNKNDNGNSFTPREYQIEILEAALKSNTIACLGTGTGKTFIAIMLIRENASAVRKPFLEGGKRVFFLVPTVPLVIQQAKTIKEHTDLLVEGFYGDMEIDSWDKEQWIQQFCKAEVLVMTAEIFRIIVDHVFIPISQIQLLIIDECHRAQGNHPYRLALKRFVGLKQEERPRVFGLSASLLNGKCKPSHLEKKLRELEMTLQATILTASDIIDLKKYGTDPKESIIPYSRYYPPAQTLLEEIKNLVSSLKFKIPDDQRKEASCYLYDDIVFFEKPAKCLNSLAMILGNLGPWCASKAAQMYIMEVRALLRKYHAKKYAYIFSDFCDFLEYFSKMCSVMVPGAYCPGSMPAKLEKLVDIFREVKKNPLFQETTPLIRNVTFDEDPEQFCRETRLNQEKNNEIGLCSLIFVEQRITAYVIKEWLLEIKNTVSELSFLNPEYVVGHGNITMPQTSMSESIQRQKLKDFREKKINVLVTTQVMEEGMDIPKCNLVVRFHLPPDFRSYVQSKGRARAKNSVFVMLVEQGEKHEKFKQDLDNFESIEKMLVSKCHDRTGPDEENIAAHMTNEVIPPYMPKGPKGPRITGNAAISLINRYCKSLPCDMAYKLAPYWKTVVVNSDTYRKKFVCELRMPINSPLRQTIVSETMPRANLAKVSAALQACKLLDEMGEMNEDLVPIGCLAYKTIAEDLEEEEVESGIKTGTSKRKQIYHKRVPSILRNAIPEPMTSCYLNILEMNVVVPLPPSLNPGKRPLIDPKDSPRGLALLTRVKLPQVNPFTIFTECGRILITINTSESPITLTKDEICRIEEFHHFIFSDALWLEENKVFLPSYAPAAYYVLPVNRDQNNKYEVDWAFLSETQLHPYHNQKSKTSTNFGGTSFDEKMFSNAVLLCQHKRDFWKFERPTFHLVLKIANDMSPKSYIEGSNRTFKEHYFQEYNVPIQNENQPLVETIQYPSSEMWKPLYISKEEKYTNKKPLIKIEQMHQDFHEYLVPELCLVHPFLQPFFFLVNCLPTILFRLRGLLLAEEIRETVAREAFVGTPKLNDNLAWPKFCPESSDDYLIEHFYGTGQLKREHNKGILTPRDIIKDSHGKITSFEVNFDLKNSTGPSPSLLLQALTARSAGDEFHLERLAMIGNSFLKYVMSVNTYVKYNTFDEGRLSRIRSSLVQNLNLYQKAKKKNLGEYLATEGFSCTKTWLPPCYVPRSTTSEEHEGEDVETSSHCQFTKQLIPDICLADSVEALIGAYLLSCGHQGALRFMSWLGLKPLLIDSPSEEDFLNWPPAPPDPIVGQLKGGGVQQRLEYLTGGFDRFEKLINYTFQNKAYLLQAFTHPSYYYNDLTDCYQRLEFLGDAILDYLITRQLYEDPCGHSPGKLTDLRAALVNNVYFASLAVTYKYEKFLKMLSPHLFRLVERFLEASQECEGFKFFETHKYYLKEVECFDLDEVEVPKALGDVFESVAGAIYLDSGMSLDTVWRVCYPMIKPAMDHLTQHIPMSPIREMYEKVHKIWFPNYDPEIKTPKLFGSVFMKGDKTYIEVTLPCGKKFHGVGQNKKVAKISAAKRTLAYLKSQEMIDTSSSLLTSSFGVSKL